MLKSLLFGRFGRVGEPKYGHRHGCIHEIPETSCPPRCVGRIEWTIGRGATPEATIVVRNVGQIARPFTFSATALLGANPGSASIQVDPGGVTLQPGESTVVRVKLQDSLALQACQDYRAEVLIKGAWEQCVQIVCHVVRDAYDAVVVELVDSQHDKSFHLPKHKSDIKWEIDRGVTPEAAITVRNTTGSTQVLTIEPSALVGANGAGQNGAGATLAVVPDSLELNAGQSEVVRVQLKNSSALSPCQEFCAELLIRGVLGQRLEVICYVGRDATSHCEVEQGESPTRRRAHHWYDHFQCTEPCLPGSTGCP